MREGLSIAEDTTVTMAGPLNGLPIADIDRFRTRNDFFGGQFGIETEFHYRRFSLDLFGKCAVGDVSQVARIDGVTNLFGVVVPGGLFAVGSNMGQFERDRFGVVPEAGARPRHDGRPDRSRLRRLHVPLLETCRRPGDLDRPSVNVNLVPTAPTVRPARRAGAAPPVFETSDYWCTG